MVMPERSRARLERLRTLPQSEDLVLEGALAPSGAYVQERGETMEAWVAIWVEAESGLVRTTNVIDALEAQVIGSEALLDAFVEACFKTVTPGDRPALPGAARVADGELWIAIRDELAAAGVRAELVEELPQLQAALDALRGYLGAGGPPPGPFSWKIDEELLRPLYAAAASYARRRPWEWMDDDPPIAVELGKSGPNARASTLYGCVLGAAGMVRGIAFYLSRAAFRRAVESGEDLMVSDEAIDGLIEQMRAQGEPVDEIPQDVLRGMLASALGGAGGPGGDVPMEDSMVVFFDPAEEMDPTYLEWVESQELPVASRAMIPRFFRVRPSGKVSNLTTREARAMTLALQAVTELVSRMQRRSKKLPEGEAIAEVDTQVTVGAGKDRQAVRVVWPGD